MHTILTISLSFKDFSNHYTVKDLSRKLFLALRAKAYKLSGALWHFRDLE